MLPFVEWRLALSLYQDHHMLLLTLAGRGRALPSGFRLGARGRAQVRHRVLPRASWPSARKAGRPSRARPTEARPSVRT